MIRFRHNLSSGKQNLKASYHFELQPLPFFFHTNALIFSFTQVHFVFPSPSRSMYLLCYAPNEPFLLPLPEIRSLSYQNRTKSNRLKFRPGSSAGEARQTLLCKYEQDFCFPWVNQLHRQSPSLNILLLQKFHGY